MGSSRHRKLDAVEHAWRDNRDQVKLDIRKVTRRLEDAVLEKLATDFDAALARGELIELRPGEVALTQLVKRFALELPE